MKTIGDIFLQKRKAKKFEQDDIARGTKIRKEFVDAIEKGKWSSLPDYAVLSGFIKNIADYLDIDNRKALAIFKRDYPPKQIAVNPKPDVLTKFAWSPKATFVLGSVVLGLFLFGYLAFQYFGSIKPPELTVTSPTENSVITDYETLVAGKTSPDATITANDQPILVAENGEFADIIEVVSDAEAIKVVALSRNGKITEVTRAIKVEVPSR